ncbi:MAG TPA: hypothetical protein VGC54_10415 [Planctomycetota bacterium]
MPPSTIQPAVSASRGAALTLVLALASAASVLLVAGGDPGRTGADWELRQFDGADLEAGASLGWLARPDFALDAGQVLHPALRADQGFQIRGAVVFPRAGRYRLRHQVEGGTLLASTPQGWIEAEAEQELQIALGFTRSGAGPARLQTWWEMETDGLDGFRPEPLPAVGARAHEMAMHAARLMELGCANCHAAGAEAGAWRRPAPYLGLAAARLRPEWLRAWIRHPQQVRPGSGMPDSFGAGPAEDADAEALVHWLAATAEPLGWTALASEPTTIALGRKLYHEAGCVGCHGPLEPAAVAYGEPDLPARLPADPPVAPFQDLGPKWWPRGLAAFLADPALTHPDGRMPSLQLTAQEAELLAGYLLQHFGAKAPIADFEPDPAAARRGREVFVERGCESCHAVAPGMPDLGGAKTAAPLTELGGRIAAGAGCMGEVAQGRPHYALASRERAGLAATAARAQGPPAPLAETLRRFAYLNCLACHAKDGAGGLAAGYRPYFRSNEAADLGDEGRLPPDLSGAGFKLQTGWMDRVVREGAAVRGALIARMPAFGAVAAGLAEGLARADGVWPHRDAPWPEPVDARVLAGRNLAGEKGFACTSCHAFGAYASIGAPPLETSAERLRYAWWAVYAHDPQRLKPGTRMPRYFEHGVSTLTDVLDGDADAQVDAMWAWFSLGEFMPAPTGIPRPGGLVLEVGERPRVFRTFLQDAGSRAIAVGFPVGTHYAFDAQAVRLVDAWKGAFLDASGAWAGRGGNVTGGRGPEVWRAPPGPALLAGLQEPPAAWPDALAGAHYLGYRLEPDGTPVMAWEFESEGARMLVQERTVPHPDSDQLLLRRFTIADLKAGQRVWVRCGPGTGMTARAVENGAMAAERTNDAGELVRRAFRPFAYNRPMVLEIEVSQ